MLEQNDVLITQYPIRFTGGTAAGQTGSSRNNFSHTENCMNRYFNSANSAGNTSSATLFDLTTAVPVGYSGVYAEMQSMKASGLASSIGINGVANVSANARMLGPINATINNYGNVASNTYLYGHTNSSISATINVGAALSANTIAGAVLGYAVDGSYSVNNVLRIIAAVAGGRVSGGPNNPAFTDLSNTHSVVTGTVDSNGNRTAVTLNPF